MEHSRVRRQHGASLLDCLVGLTLGLLVLQALVDALGSVARAVQARRDDLLRHEAHALVHEVLRNVIAESATGAAAPALHAESGPHGARLHARADGNAALACAASPTGVAGHVQHLWTDADGTLQCAVDRRVAQPVADGVGRWTLEFVEAVGSADAPRLRVAGVDDVRDWRRVRLVRARLRAAATHRGRGPAVQEVWVAAPALEDPA